MSNPLPFPGAFSGAELDEAILKVRTTLLQGVIPAANGNVNGPSLSFASETNSGLYRAGAGDVRLSILGHDQTTWTATATKHSRQVQFTDGYRAGPGMSFVNDATSGLYRNAANDVRLSINSTDILCMGFVTASGATNAPSLGLGKFPERGGLHLLVNNSAATGTGIQLENNDPTDGCATGFSIRCTTTGVGGGSMAEIAKFNVRIDVHDHATRTSHLDFAFTEAGTTKFIQFIGVGGFRTVRSDSGALQVQGIAGELLLSTGSANQDVRISPHGTGNIVHDVGKRLRIATGTGARAGDATLVAGTVTVANTTVTANTKVITSRKTSGGTLGFLVYSVSAGVSFTITSSSATDTSVVSYWLIEVS